MTVAIVTGASYGVGRGIALGLGEAGATVYVTGRSIERTTTAADVTRLGGKGIAITCDHADDAQIERLIARVLAEAGHIDVLVNNVFAIPPGTLTGNFWELPLEQWDTMHRVGLRSHYVACWYAAPAMVARRAGLIVNVSSFGAKIRAVNVAYGVGKAGVDRMSRDMGRELARHGVTCVSIWPGIVRTERVLADPAHFGFDLTVSETPQFSGRAVAALAKDPDVIRHSGEALVVAELARAYGFTDIDGTVPASLRRST